MRAPMRDLPVGARFVGPDERTEYEITAIHPDGPHHEVWVRNLTMTDQEAERLLATPGAVAPGEGPRDGMFITGQVSASVEVLG